MKILNDIGWHGIASNDIGWHGMAEMARDGMVLLHRMASDGTDGIGGIG